MDVVHVCVQWDDQNDMDVPLRRDVGFRARRLAAPERTTGFFFDWSKWNENPCSRIRDSEIFAVRRIILELWILAVPDSCPQIIGIFYPLIEDLRIFPVNRVLCNLVIFRLCLPF